MKIRVRYTIGRNHGHEIVDSFENVSDMMKRMCEREYFQEAGIAQFAVIVKTSPAQETCTGDEENN